MHPSALENCKLFFDTYSSHFIKNETVKVIEIGSQDVNGSLRSVCPTQFNYTGIDFIHGKGVDLILDDPYKLPFPDNSTDIILSSSCFEHSEMFWVLFLEIIRVLKPNGLFYLNVPSNGMFHRYPVDCWRFYPDSGKALVTWSKKNGINSALVESFISLQTGGDRPEYQWNDYVAVFTKYENTPYNFKNLIKHNKLNHINGSTSLNDEYSNFASFSEDYWKLAQIKMILDGNSPNFPNMTSDEKNNLILNIIDNKIKPQF